MRSLVSRLIGQGVVTGDAVVGGAVRVQRCLREPVPQPNQDMAGHRQVGVVQDAVDFGEDLLDFLVAALAAPDVHDERRLDAVKRRRDGGGGASVRDRSKV